MLLNKVNYLTENVEILMLLNNVNYLTMSEIASLICSFYLKSGPSSIRKANNGRQAQVTN